MNKNITIKKIIIFTIYIVSIICIVFLVRNVIFDVNRKSFGSVKLVTEYDENTTIDDMETVTFGSYPQSDITGNIKEPIEWIVLDRQENKCLLLSKYILDCKCYDDRGNKNTWETCSLRNWLNEKFYNIAFNNDEKNKIINSTVINNDNMNYILGSCNYTCDNVFLLSIIDMREYFGNGTKIDSYTYQLGKKVTTEGTEYAKSVFNISNYLDVYNEIGIDDDEYQKYNWAFGNSPFWLRSPGDYSNFATFVNCAGGMDMNGTYVYVSDFGVRPALWVSY